MANNYDTIEFDVKNEDIITIKGYYDYKSSNVTYEKTLNLTYKIFKLPEISSLEDFMSEFVEKLLINGILRMQSKNVCWRRLVIKTPRSQIAYNLTGETKGVLDLPIKGAFSAYKFEIQKRSGRTVYLTLFGVPQSISQAVVTDCERLFLEPLLLERSECELRLSGIRAPNEDLILSIIGRGMKQVPTYTKKKPTRTAPKRTKIKSR